MKEFARWLYMKTHREELLQVARAVRQPHNSRGNIVDKAMQLGEINGANNALATLDLLVR